ncbi:protein O18 [Cercopithecine betaherpesvirus 5]|uniref:Protein O18 n=1 Tax=Simian cytomegalovirus (strain Colburn) TaxID=50292 RepID=G8XTK2_SCMVC|nr:protein O18 [Cercopithecine betaherpesvirus 5]AEV80494.1 protein O18 [Cercopithecine betaherpesvirus 5]
MQTWEIILVAVTAFLAFIALMYMIIWGYLNRKYAPWCLTPCVERISVWIEQRKKSKETAKETAEAAEVEEGAVDAKDETCCVCPLWCASAWAQICQCFSRCFARIGKFMTEVFNGERCSNEVARENLHYYFPCCFQFWNWLRARLCPTEPRQSRRGQPADKTQTKVDCVTVELEDFSCQVPTVEIRPVDISETEEAEANETEVLVHRCPSNTNVKETVDDDPEAIPESNPEPDESEPTPEPTPVPHSTPEPTPDPESASTPQMPIVNVSGMSPQVAAAVQAAVEAALKTALGNTPTN